MKSSRSNYLIALALAFSMICFASCKSNNSAESTPQALDTISEENVQANSIQEGQVEQAKQADIESGSTEATNDSADQPSNPPENAQPENLPAYRYPGDDPIHKVAADYLIHEIGKLYDPADICIPSMSIVATDTTNTDDILVWGDFWVFNYKLDNDTLLTQSGGSHAGLMHLKKTDDSYIVTKMDIVADGADNLKSTKEIFGDKYDAFHKINSNADEREKIRRQFISDYVKTNKLQITKVKDFGWDAVELPM